MILLENYIAIEVPKGDFGLFVWNNKLCANERHHGVFIKVLPPGDWRFLFTTEGMTEEQAEMVVGHKRVCFVYGQKGYRTVTKRGSFNSLLQSRGLSLDKNYAILEKIT